MVDEAKLTSYLQRRQKGRGIPTDAREAADSMVNDGILTNFQSEQFLLGKWRGFTIGKYKLLERIGVGGMGQVFLCEHMFMKRRVAIKVLPPAKAEQPAALGRFYREARAAGSLEHPNIVRTHDIDQDGNLHFIVMEYVDGSNLLEIVKKHGPMDIGRAAAYLKSVASGLDFAFRSGIIHRDVKPGNILIDRRGNARILDMGLARFFKDQSDMLTVKYDDKIVLGTADYVAPEQVANSHSVDVRADVYALGATLYFLLAGHPPFPTGTVSQKLLWHRTKEPTPIKQIRPEISDELAAVVTKMMAKDPSARYQTPSDVVLALQSYVPAHVPAPSLQEMPVLCPAVLEGMEQLVELEPQESPAPVESKRVVAAATIGSNAKTGSTATLETKARPATRPSVNPFGAAPVNPFGSQPKVDAKGSHGGHAGGQAGGHGSRPQQPSPFGSSPRVSDATPQPMPFHPPGYDPRASANSQQRAPQPTRSQQIALYVILGASVLVGGGIIYAKFLKPRVVPAIQSQVVEAPQPPKGELSE
jgi:eukaryotic-like serine/threonine-protein kinase